MLTAMKRIGAILALWIGMSLAMAAPIGEIEVKGADPVLSALARIALPFSIGDEPGDLEAARKAILDSGFFKQATLTLQGNKLLVDLIPNPSISKVTVESKTFAPEAIVQSLEANLALGAGATYNPLRAEEARQAIAQTYRRQGFPFTPAVKVEAREESGGVVLRFAIEENPELKEVVLGNLSYIPRDRVEPLFREIGVEGRFDFGKYFNAVQQATAQFATAGFRGSGVDAAQTLLQNGKLTIAFVELRVAEVVGVGLETSQLGLKGGDPLNYSLLLDGVNTLSRGLGREVLFRLENLGNGVRILLEVGGIRYGRIREVRVEGNTALPAAQLLAALRLKTGDLFQPELANEDFATLLGLYRQAGYELVGQPSVRFQDGVYIQTLQEVQIVGYKLVWDGNHRTIDNVILRELPATPTLLSQTTLRTIYTNLAATQLLKDLPGVSFEGNPESPARATLVLRLKETSTGLFFPGFGYSSFEGWSGNLTFRETNLFGLAHQPSLDFSFGQNDAGENFSLSAGYQIPWIYLDFLDFEKVRTSVNFSVYTLPRGNLKLLDSANPLLEDQETGWEYTERKTGISLGFGRAWSQNLPNLRFNLTLATEWVDPSLETADPAAPTCDENPSTPALSCSDPSYYSLERALALLTTPYQTASVGLAATYSDANSNRFPTAGYAGTLSARYGLNLPEGEQAQQFIPLVATAKTYLGLGADNRQALALRVSGGTILGQPPESERFKLGGSQSEVLTLRGYPDASFIGNNLVSATLEYRLDFNLSPNGGTNVYGILFADGASVWDNNEEIRIRYGAGLGVQINLEFFGFPFPPVRMDYGFSPDYPSGRFHFRLGALF